MMFLVTAMRKELLFLLYKGDPKVSHLPKERVDFLNSKLRTYKNPTQMRKTVKSAPKEAFILTEVNSIKVSKFL